MKFPMEVFYPTFAEDKAKESKCSKRKGRREVFHLGHTSRCSMFPKQSAEF